jgi:hypothetical protein
MELIYFTGHLMRFFFQRQQFLLCVLSILFSGVWKKAVKECLTNGDVTLSIQDR